jgi:uncharacterized protein YbjT (DUF2867 family)
MSTTAQKTALILGATDLVGGHVLRFLLESPTHERVIALVRKPSLAPRPKLDAGHFQGVNDLFLCLGTTLKKAGSKEAFRRVDFDYPREAAR